MKLQTDARIDELEGQYHALKREIAALRRERPPERVSNYVFERSDETRVRLADLFEDKDHLILVHNMGRRCAYCTMWADGLNGLLPHLRSRASFVVSSADPPAEQRALARSRNWSFPMVSVRGTDFIADMGFVDETLGSMPGVSVFERAPDGAIYRVGRAEFAPGDDYCAVWHLFELMPEGVNE